MNSRFGLALAIASLVSTAAQGALFVETDPVPFATASGTTPALTSSAQAKIGAGSWQANGVAKSSIGFTPADFGMPSFKVSDITSFSWSTYKSTTGGSAPDWYLTIYTAPDGVDDDASWYGRRMTFEGLYAYNFSNPANQWNTYSSDPGVNQLTLIDSNTTNFGFYNGPTLADAQSGPIDWGAYPTSSSVEVVDYSNETVMFMVLETGSGWAAGFDGFLDDFNFSVEVDNGSGPVAYSATVDFEPAAVVPEASSVAVWGLLGMTVGGLGWLRRRRFAV